MIKSLFAIILLLLTFGLAVSARFSQGAHMDNWVIMLAMPGTICSLLFCYLSWKYNKRAVFIVSIMCLVALAAVFIARVD